MEGCQVGKKRAGIIQAVPKWVEKTDLGRICLTAIAIMLTKTKADKKNAKTKTKTKVLTCHGDQVDKSPGQVLLEDVKGSSQVLCVS